MMNNNTILSLQNVSYTKDGVNILSGIDFTCLEDHNWMVFGPNGSGKTTILNIINGYIWPTAGRVSVLGRELGSYSVSLLRQSVGYMSSSIVSMIPPDEKALHVAASGLNGTLGTYSEYSDYDLSAAAEAMEKINASDISDKPFGHLSQGQQQRVLIGRALVSKPKLLILDEPCAGLDPVARERLLDDLGQTVKNTSSPAIIYVTHHTVEIRPWITNILLIKAGKIFRQGQREDIINSANLSGLFGCKCLVKTENGKYFMSVVK